MTAIFFAMCLTMLGFLANYRYPDAFFVRWVCFVLAGVCLALAAGIGVGNFILHHEG